MRKKEPVTIEKKNVKESRILLPKAEKPDLTSTERILPRFYIILLLLLVELEYWVYTTHENVWLIIIATS